MTQYGRTITTLLMLVVLSTGLFLFSQYQTIQKKAIEGEKKNIAAYIQDRAGAILLPEDFTAQDTIHQHIVFEGFFDTIQSPRLVRLKVWNRNAVVLWSNLDALIGHQFPENQDVKKALEGEVKFAIMPARLGQFSERDYAELSETFVPFFDANGQVVGVINVYTSTVQLRETIRQEFQRRAVAMSVIMMLGFALVALVLRHSFKPSRKLS